jgi:hypothetical protein
VPGVVPRHKWPRLGMFWRGREVFPLEAYNARAVNTAGPFIAIGNPRSRVPQIGPIPVLCGETERKQVVRQFLTHAQGVVILRPGTSEPTQWEAQTALEVLPPQRLFILYSFPSVADTDLGKMSNAVKNVLSLHDFAKKCLPGELPLDIPEESVLSFSTDGTVFVKAATGRRSKLPFANPVGNALFKSLDAAGLVNRRPLLPCVVRGFLVSISFIVGAIILYRLANRPL